eukprot:8372325-Pyramimonas_sp.AAC.1
MALEKVQSALIAQTRQTFDFLPRFAQSIGACAQELSARLPFCGVRESVKEKAGWRCSSTICTTSRP